MQCSGDQALLRLADEADATTPPEPPELYEQVRYTGHEVVWPGNGSPVNREPWSREELIRMTEGKHPFWDEDYRPSLECQAQCRGWLALLDEHEATKKRIWAPHDRLEKQWERQVDKQWWLFLQIIRTKAETLQGVAAQFEVLERYWYPHHSDSPKVDAAIPKMMANVRRIVVAQSAEA